MSRSTRTSRTTGTDSRTSRSTGRNDGGAARRLIGSPSRTPRASASRKLRHFTFQFNRDEVTKDRGSNNVRITDRSSNSSIELTLAEARSLYNLLSDQFNG
jgi:hypothetical protein